ncbi:TPA: phage distal tail protein domain-containing protein [Streptococcus suis]
MVRNFKLINARGDVLDLMQFGHFGYAPKGLGIELSNEYSQSDADFLFNSLKLAQGELNLSVAFGLHANDAYRRFYESVSFFNYQPLSLSYATDGMREHFRDCRLKSLSKTELQKGRILDEELVLEFTSPWYRWEEGERFVYTDQIGDGKVYGYGYDYVYEENLSEHDIFFVIQNDSLYFGIKESSPVEIVIEAVQSAIVNPSWEVHAGGRVVQSDGYRLTIPVGYRLVVSSNPQDVKAVLVSPEGESENVYQYQDMTKTNFVTVPIGKSFLFFQNIRGANVRYTLRKEAVLV